MPNWLLLPESFLPDEDGNFESRSSTQTICYRGKTLLALQATIHPENGKGRPYVVVPGYKASEPFRYDKNIQQVEIQEIPPSERVVVKKLLRRRKFKGPINFW